MNVIGNLKSAVDAFETRMRIASDAGAHHLRLANGSHCSIDLAERVPLATHAGHTGIRRGWWNRDQTAIPTTRELLEGQESMQMKCGDAWQPVTMNVSIQ